MNTNLKRESTSIALHCETPAASAERKTFICFGTPRGGTSMVAGAMIGLGVDMGSNLKDNQEDPIFASGNFVAMIAEVDRRNQSEIQNWGWKFPNAANYLDRIQPKLINPHLVIVMRDVVATAKAHMRWHSKQDMGAISDVILSQQRNLYLALRWQVPTLMVSYEKAAAFPQSFIAEFCEFSGLPIPPVVTNIVEFMVPGKYKAAPTARPPAN